MSSGGTSSLILREIPHRGIAYVRLLTVREPDSLIRESVAFCRQCGAGQVYVTQGTEPLEGLPHTHDILRLQVEKEKLPPLNQPVNLLPMTPENDAIYQRIYNRCFSEVPGAATYDRAEIRRIYDLSQEGFLALDEMETPFGMGELHDSELAAVGILPEFRRQHLGKPLTLSLLLRCPGPILTLTAASVNEPALALYDSLGFRVCGLISRWYMAQEDS